MFKLKNNNINSLLKSVPIDQLCKTFQDAIVVTRSLGLSYLWIDSICIIQDNDDDWRQEAARMSDVYANAVVNIAAAGAKDGSIGLFFNRDVLRETKHYVRIAGSEVYELREARLYGRSLENTCLTARGWCFQERFLARGTLHFTNKQIFFECHCQTTCESCPEGFPDSLWYFRPTKRILPKERDGPGTWFKAVTIYSAAQLSFCKDKLIAISGVARHVQNITHGQYVAGLWRTKLERQLCWRVDRDDKTSVSQIKILPSPPSEFRPLYLAPSWSWASTNGPITWKLDGYTLYHRGISKYSHPLIKIQNVELFQVGPDKLGQLHDARLVASCSPMIMGKVFLSLFEPYKRYWKHDSDDYKKYAEMLYEVDSPRQRIWFDSEQGGQNLAEPIFFLPTVDYLYQLAADYGGRCGLIVTMAEGRGHGYFSRLGVWDMQFNLVCYRAMMNKLLFQPGSLVDESIYQEILERDKNGIPRYTVTLV